MFLILLLAAVSVTQAALPGFAGSVPSNRIAPSAGIHPPGANNEATPAEKYLVDFGYIPKTSGPEPPTPFELQMGILRFQLFHGLYRSGLFDVQTEETMALHRCEDPDMQNGAALTERMLLHPRFRSWRLRLNAEFAHKLGLAPKTTTLWKRRILTYAVEGTPNTLSSKEARTAIKDAFSKWQTIAGFQFIEIDTASKADIVVSFEQMKDKKHSTVVSRASGPEHSRIVLDSTAAWSYTYPRAGTLPVYRAVLHSIGHVLGLSHNPEVDSLMNPLLKSAQLITPLAAVPTADNVALRKLYGLAVPTSGPSVAGDSRLCPRTLDSVTAVSDAIWYLFHDFNVWQIKNKLFSSEPQRIRDVFPGGPDFINATVTSNGLTVLFADRNIYGYQYDAGRFVKAPGFPRELHERVLFFPQAAFPLTNGSVVLLSKGNAFATYDVVTNLPHILNDKNRMFPNLPDSLKSGVPIVNQDFAKYYVFDDTKVGEWDSTTHIAGPTQPINVFFKCT